MAQFIFLISKSRTMPQNSAASVKFNVKGQLGVTVFNCRSRLFTAKFKINTNDGFTKKINILIIDQIECFCQMKAGRRIF